MRNNDGFTLIEIMVTVAVSMIILGTVTAMLFTAYRVNASVSESNKVLNASSSIFETVRKISAGAEIVEVTDTLPADLTGKDYISCVDNVVTVNGGKLYNAADLNAARLILKYTVEDAGKGVVQCELSILDANGDNMVQPQIQALYLDEATSIVGTEGNYIVFTDNP